MGLIVIAEGVEDGKVLRALRSQGCDEAQGYYLTRPLGAEELVAWLEARADGTGAPAST
jgi:EAL domain-containing protein (putative c-di-GMP-specific phosphodiesterase class I)